MATERAEADGNVLAYLDGLMHRLSELAPVALRQGRVEAVHQCRVSTRRLAAALDLFRPHLPGSRYEAMRRVLRKLRRRLGKLRDLHVMVGHLEALGAGGKHRRAVAWVRSALRRQHADARAKAARQGEIAGVMKGLGQWQAVREKIARSGDGRGLLTRAVKKQTDELAERARTPGGDPHALRIAGKQLRYTFELAKEAGLPVPRRLAGAFKAMQDALGLWHDWVVLAGRVMEEALEADLAVHDTALFRECLGLTSHLTRRAEAQLARFHRLWDGNGQLIRGALAAQEN